MSFASTRPAVARRAVSCCARERGGLLFAQLREVGFRAFDFDELFLDLRGALGQLFGCYAMFARQLFDGREAAFHLVLPGRVDV